ncbi:response regulator [Dorea longicatena]|uniref:response regulator n=1 Tax=Dorea longicatena TaxID=88431 RepID=UPI001FBA2B53|nr:response regulator [Dorea longicatena]
MDGIETARQIRKRIGKEITIIVLTSYEFSEIGVKILQMTGAEVETAENGKIAVEKVEASPKGLYDLIFMDIQMPVMNGYEATAAIRSLPGELGKLPIVAMTANAFAEDVQLVKNTGMNEHIAKPLDMNKLNDVLENWL